MTTSLRDQGWTIPDEGTTSNAILRAQEDIIGVIVPFTNVQSATFSFEGSVDGINFFPIKPDDAVFTIARPAAVKSIVTFAAEKLHGPPWIRVVGASAETSGPIVLTPIFRRYF